MMSSRKKEKVPVVMEIFFFEIFSVFGYFLILWVQTTSAKLMLELLWELF